MSRLAFTTEWLDPLSGVVWKYQLFYHVATKEVEMFDIKNRRQFLKKTKCEQLDPSFLYIGNRITVLSRQLKILEYNDEYTRNQLEGKRQRTLAMVKPDAFQHLGKIVHTILENGFVISNMKVFKLSKPEAQKFYAVHDGKPFYEKLTTFMSSGRVCAMELVGENAVQRWRELLGPTNSELARQTAPNSIRARFGTDGSFNAAHGSDAPETAQEEIKFFFSPESMNLGKCDVGKDTTLGLVKPSALLGGSAGFIIDTIQAHFQITALAMFKLDTMQAAEFYEVYKGVVPPGEFHGMVEELASGPCIAIEVADRDGADPVEAFRGLCGPMDPDIGKILRPGSLRSAFGVSKVKNAVHCTDLPEDGPLEVAYFFNVLSAA